MMNVSQPLTFTGVCSYTNMPVFAQRTMLTHAHLNAV